MTTGARRSTGAEGARVLGFQLCDGEFFPEALHHSIGGGK